MLEESLLKFKQTNKDFDKDFFRFQRHEEANFKLVSHSQPKLIRIDFFEIGF